LSATRQIGMTSTSEIPWPRLLAEGAAIVTSILLAFAIQAWWDNRIQEEQRQEHLSALTRDFDQMYERAMASHVNAERAVNTGIEILTRISIGTDWNRETATIEISDLFVYEVFSPSIGGYESLVSSGSLEVLSNVTLKRELVDFFGSFEDMRISEQLLIIGLSDYWRSTEFGHLVGVHRMPVPEYPKFDAPPVEDWNDSEFFVNMIAAIALAQKDVMQDYQYLLERIEGIRNGLAEEASVH